MRSSIPIAAERTSRRRKAPSPALVVAMVALFVALGGGAALASAMISGKNIIDHSIAKKKLTTSAVQALQGGPHAISINKNGVAPFPGYRQLTAAPIHGLIVDYACGGSGDPYIYVRLRPATDGDLVNASGDRASDGSLVSVQEASETVYAEGVSTANLDVIAWAGSDGTISRFDLGGYDGGTACNVWALITPGS